MSGHIIHLKKYNWGFSPCRCSSNINMSATYHHFEIRFDVMYNIYRYDGRGHLYDLRPYDAEQLDDSAFDMSEQEKAMEAACDEERYLELRSDILEKQMYEGM